MVDQRLLVGDLLAVLEVLLLDVLQLLDLHPALDLQVGAHDGAGGGDPGHRYAGVGAGVGLGIGRRGGRERGVPAGAGPGIAGVAPAVVVLQVALPVRLHQGDLVVVLVGVGALRLVDVPDQQAGAGQRGVEAGLLAILDQEVLLAGSAVLPQAIEGVGVLHVMDADHRIGGAVVDAGPTLVRLAPGAGMARGVTPTTPAAGGHQAPVADAFGGPVGVVEVGEAEQQVSQFVGADADLAVFWHGEVAEHLDPVRVLGAAVEGPLVRPDVAAAAGDLGAGSGVDDDEGVDEAVAVIVVGGEVHRRVGRLESIAGQGLGVGLRTAGPRLAVGIGCERLRHAERADHVALDVDQPVGDVLIVLTHALGRDHPLREEQVAEVLLGLDHGLVGEIDQNDDHPQHPAQRGAVRRGAADHAEGGSDGKGFRGQDDAVVEAHRRRFAGLERERGRHAARAAQRFHGLDDGIPEVRMGRDDTSLAVIGLFHPVDYVQVVPDKLLCGAGHGGLPMGSIGVDS